MSIIHYILTKKEVEQQIAYLKVELEFVFNELGISDAAKELMIQKK